MKPSIRNLRSVSAALLVASIASTSLAAQATTDRQDPMREPVTMTFSFDPAELTTTEGARRAYRRLQSLARRHCTVPGATSNDLRRHDSACAADLVAKVVARTGSTRLAAQHRGALAADVAARR